MSRGWPRDGPAANALRLAAQSLHRSPTVLGDSYRRMRYRQGRVKATTFTAHKLAHTPYTLVTTRQFYDETVLAQRWHQTRVRKTRRPKNQGRRPRF